MPVDGRGTTKRAERAIHGAGNPSVSSPNVQITQVGTAEGGDTSGAPGSGSKGPQTMLHERQETLLV